MLIPFGIIIFFFGTIIGSFLNVVIYRYRSGKTLGGRSMCFSCGKTLRWHELVPLASFFVQGGKCKRCRSQISWQYPIVEAVTGFTFLLVAIKYAYLLPASAELFCVILTYCMFLFCLLIVMCFYDLRHMIIPEELVWVFNSVAFVGMFCFIGDSIILHIPDIFSIFAGPIIAAPFFLITFISKGRLMGMGDVKLMLGIGWLLGLSAGIMAVILAFWIGAIVSILLLILKRSHFGMKTQIPFGPFLVLATVVVFVLGINILSFAQIFS